MRVEIYWNLHRKCFSVRVGGRVVAHADAFIMARSVAFVVQPAGNAKVRRTGKKNVHAFVRGELAAARIDGQWRRPVTWHFDDGTTGVSWGPSTERNLPTHPEMWKGPDQLFDAFPVTYDPYQDTSFVTKKQNWGSELARVPVQTADRCAGFTVGGVRPELYAEVE